ncbi:MAG: Gldg family protein, partial [Methylococcales bacterium]|nr:Gldg family protein [Methylococcales bacterium]
MAKSLMRSVIAMAKLLAGIILIAALAWLSQQYRYKTDLSSHKRNTLPVGAAAILKSLQGPLKITAVVQDSPELHRRIEKTVERLQQTQPDITVDFESAQTRITQENTELNQSGKLELEYNGNHETLHSLSETDLIAAIRRLIRGGEQWVVFIEGHDEKSLFDETATGYEKLDTLIQKQGYRTLSLNLVKTPSIPTNTTLLVLAAPQQPMLPGELKVITDYLQKGGNFLWLREPQQTVEKLQDTIPVEFLPGVMISNNSKMREVLGIQHPAVIPIVDYGTHKITQGVTGQSLFAIASAVSFNGEPPWQSTALLLSLP